MNDPAYTTSPTAGVQRDRNLGDSMVMIENLKEYFPLFEGILQKKTDEVRTADGVSFPIAEGETFDLVGESDSGKTITGRSMPRLAEPTSGWVEIDGQDVVDLSDGEPKRFRRNVQVIHQDSSPNLNPHHRVKSVIEAPLKIHDYGDSEARLERVEGLLDMVDLPWEFMYHYPGQPSGGQKQCISIARTVALNPKLVVLNEPMSALDVSVQARVISVPEEMQEEFDITYPFITHDLSLLKNVADHIDVMYLGRLVGVGDADSVLGSPQYSYSRILFSTVSIINEEDELAKPDRITLDGEMPDSWEEPSGCVFRPRCAHEFDACAIEEPKLYERGANQVVRCFLHDDRFEEGAEWE